MQVYDVSHFADDHPGGTVISTYFGRDGTDVFATFHPPAAWKQLNDYYIGDLVVSQLFRLPHPHVDSNFSPTCG